MKRLIQNPLAWCIAIIAVAVIAMVVESALVEETPLKRAGFMQEVPTRTPVQTQQQVAALAVTKMSCPVLLGSMVLSDEQVRAQMSRLPGISVASMRQRMSSEYSRRCK